MAQSDAFGINVDARYRKTEARPRNCKLEAHIPKTYYAYVSGVLSNTG